MQIRTVSCSPAKSLSIQVCVFSDTPLD